MRRTLVSLKKGWTHTPGRTRRGGKNLAWRPKMPMELSNEQNILNAVYPRKIPNSWQEREFRRLGIVEWPKDVGFYNAGDNFELTPAMMFRLFEKNNSEEFWTPAHNEETVVHIMPLIEADAKKFEMAEAVLKSHISRFGADHTIFNVVMQAAAFAKNLDKAAVLLKEMQEVHNLQMNAQTVVNMMLAVRLSGQPREKAEAYFNEGVKIGALRPVMRLDTEFQMWWDQLERLGSFETEGFLANKEEGASSRPADAFAIWGWDKDERKFTSRKQAVKEEVDAQLRKGAEYQGTVYTRYKRQPWAKYRGVLRHDIRGPAAGDSGPYFPDAPQADASFKP